MGLNFNLNKFLTGNQYSGIEYFSFQDEQKLAIVDLVKKNNEITIVREDVKIFKDGVFKNLDKSKSYSLVVNTNQVIQKEVSEIEKADIKLLHKSFPNVNWDEFYYEILRLKSKSIVSIVRRKVVDDILLKFNLNQISIVQISIGNSAVSNIIDIVDFDVLETNRHVLNLDENKDFILTRDKKLSSSFNVNGLQILNTHLLAFSVILQSILNRKMTSSNLVNLNFTLNDNFLQTQFFNKGIQIGVGFILSLLLVNFLLFNNLFKKVDQNSQVLLLNSSSKENFIKIKERVKNKEVNVEKIFQNSGRGRSVILNEIAKKTPSSILFSGLIYQPLGKKIKREEPIIVEEGVVLVDGVSVDANSFTMWVESLEKINFIDKVIITHFGKADNNENLFSLKLMINEAKQEK